MPKPNLTVRAFVDPVQPMPQWADIIGRTFGRLLVVGYTGRRDRLRRRLVTCLCSCCGGYLDTLKANLTSGNTTSCGSTHSDQIAARNSASAKHGHTCGTRASGTKISSIYRAWAAIKGRCLSQSNAAYSYYGGRGITLYGPWAESFERFREDVEREIGPKPSREYSLDRINNDGNYEPGNLRWATAAQQNRNQRKTRRYTLMSEGEALTVGEWAERAGVRYELVESRLVTYGWPLDEALGTPPGVGRCPLKDRVKWTSTEAYARYCQTARAPHDDFAR